MAALEAMDHHGRGKASVGHTEQVGAPAAAAAAADTGPSSSLQPSSLDFRAVTMSGSAPPLISKLHSPWWVFIVLY